MSTISETCACGATFTASSRYNSEVKHAASEWREEHKHAESVGICGDRAETVGGPDLFCNLKAGHAGMHGDGAGCSWVHVDQSEDADSEPASVPLAAEDDSGAAVDVPGAAGLSEAQGGAETRDGGAGL